ncbi:MAG: lysophospholipid acyltransferase family protein, partial [Verrucomicrobia bacterium]|nr:lysophospholipid acyltransferase family protein [Verrucomicrobiota bacterium]
MNRTRRRLESSPEGVSRLTWFFRGVRRRGAYHALIVLRAVVQALPERLAHALFRFLADLVFITVGVHRRRALDNLHIAFPTMPQAQARWIVKRMLRNLARNAVEFIRFPLYSRQRILSMVTIDRKDIVDRLARDGRGAVAVSAHLGNWELLGAAIAAMGYKISVVARRIYYHRFEELLRGTRRAAGVRVVYRDEPKALLRALRDGQFLGILPDMDIVKLDSVYVEFFGRLALTPTGPVALALRTGVPLVPAFIVRNDDGSHRILVEEPLELIRTGNMQKDLLVNTMRATKAIERVIRKYPDQWMWMHRRWQ